MSFVSLARTALISCALVVAAHSAAVADDAADIRARLEQWTEDFNAKRADAVCDLFSKEAISTYRGQPNGTDEICELLQKSLADPARRFHYALDIREIIVEGSLGVVRLTWSLQVMPLSVTSEEPGMDIFRKEADGKWRIIRYMAFEAE